MHGMPSAATLVAIPKAISVTVTDDTLTVVQ